jgi:hypothetical protein
MHKLPLEPDHVGQETFGETVLAHYSNRLESSVDREFKVPIAGYDQ